MSDQKSELIRGLVLQALAKEKDDMSQAKIQNVPASPEHLRLIQGSADWKAARCGSLGASVVQDILAKTKSGYATSRDNRMADLILERLTGVPVEIFETPAMRMGKEREPAAREAYSLRVDEPVTECGLFIHPTIKGTHASPDGIVGDHGLVEIKCPQAAAHLELLIKCEIPIRYRAQMQWQMECAVRQWCDFVSFNPDFPPAMQILVCRVNRDQRAIDLMTEAVTVFLDGVERTVAHLKKQYGKE